MKIKHKNWKRKAKCVAVTLIAPFLKIAAILHFVDIFHILGSLLKCYNDGEEKIVKCDENLGYRTCFIRYNESKQTHFSDNESRWCHHPSFSHLTLKFVFCGVFFPRRRDHWERLLYEGQGPSNKEPYLSHIIVPPVQRTHSYVAQLVFYFNMILSIEG